MNVFCTLYEGDYYQGVIALVNSLIQADFEGVVCIGSRDEFNEQIRHVADTVNETYSGIEIRLRSVETDLHLARFKPFFLSAVWEDVSDISRIFYADPDLLVKAKWKNFVRWTDFGVAICEAKQSPMYHQHPVRHIWQDIADENGLSWHHKFDVYFNSGYIGLKEQDVPFLEQWKETIEICERYGNLDDRFDRRELGPLDPFTTWDQDALNIAACCYDGEVSFLTKDGMDFRMGKGGPWMSHAIGSVKPWNASYLQNALTGKSPRRVDRLYWRTYQEPFPTVDLLTQWKRRLTLNASIIVSRYLVS